MYIDETMGPFNHGNGYPIFYFIYRQWDDQSNWAADKMDGISWKFGRMGIKYYEQIYTRYGRDYNHYTLQRFIHNYGSTGSC